MIHNMLKITLINNNTKQTNNVTHLKFLIRVHY